jgi:hypothetical protein
MYVAARQDRGRGRGANGEEDEDEDEDEDKEEDVEGCDRDADADADQWPRDEVQKKAEDGKGGSSGLQRTADWLQHLPLSRLAKP